MQVGLREELNQYENSGKLPVYAYGGINIGLEQVVHEENNFIKSVALTAGESHRRA